MADIGLAKENKKRAEVTSTEIVLALLVDDEGHAKPVHNQALFAFLPLRSYGFAFAVQADFLLVASR